MKHLLSILILLGFVSVASADERHDPKPMWDISNKWICEKEYSLEGYVGSGTIKERFSNLQAEEWYWEDKKDSLEFHRVFINAHKEQTRFIDFKDKTISGLGAVSGEPWSSKIIFKKYLEGGIDNVNGGGGQNILGIKNTENGSQGFLLIDEVANYIDSRDPFSYWDFSSNLFIDDSFDYFEPEEYKRVSLSTNVWRCKPLK